MCIPHQREEISLNLWSMYNIKGTVSFFSAHVTISRQYLTEDERTGKPGLYWSFLRVQVSLAQAQTLCEANT